MAGYAQDSCYRLPLLPTSYINNPSFESGTSNCVTGYVSQFGLDLPFWHALNDEVPVAYLNACNLFQLPDNIVQQEKSANIVTTLYPLVPQPIPDGSGVVAISDYGYDGSQHIYAQQKSYVNTCLTAALQKDSTYQLVFYLGFGKPGTEFLQAGNSILIPEYSYSPEKISLFGLPDCYGTFTAIPMLGCPAVAGWMNLGSTVVSGALGTWVKSIITFTAPADINAIAIGPGCDTTSIVGKGDFNIAYQGNSYEQNAFSYFLDDLQLFKVNAPLPYIELANGNFCTNTALLQLQPASYYAHSTIQWYRNDTLINGMDGLYLQLNKANFASGQYNCRVSNDSICLSTNSIPIYWEELPSAHLLGAADSTGCLGDTVMLNAFVDTLSQYTWQDGSTAPSFAATSDGLYSVKVSNACGVALASKYISFKKCREQIYIPNAFSPNQDGINDIFKVQYDYPPKSWKLMVYNRYGQRLYYSADPSAGWDGKFQGIDQPTGTYAWQIRYTDKENKSHELTGTVILIR